MLLKSAFFAATGVWIGLVCLAAYAQAPPPAKDGAPAPEAQRVEITGTGQADDRKDANAAKTVLLRDEITRFGDASLGQVLSRVPGVVVIGSGSQAKEITMRGLGGGYTQILINGEPVPPGFLLDSLSPDLIERIEVIRSSTADSSTQAIAGTINIVLRRPAQTGQHELKLNASTYQGLGSSGLTSQYGNKDGAWSYSMASSINQERDRWLSRARTTTQDALGRPLSELDAPGVENGKKLTVGVAPRVVFKPNDEQSITLDGLLQAQRFTYEGQDLRRTLFGTPPTFDRNDSSFVSDTLQARLGMAWNTAVGDEGKLTLKANGSLLRRRLDYLFDGFLDGMHLLTRTLGSDLQDSSLSLNGKFSLGLAETHTLGTGWDVQTGRRREDRIQRESSNTGFATQDLDEDYAATVNRLAFYLQDEWAVSKNLSGYAGLRWEGLETRTRGLTLTPVQQRSSVWSPTMQWVWKVPETQGDQLRWSVGRSYKAPTARDLIPRRWVVPDNSPTAPNFQGNPALVPELAWGMDLGYERYVGRDVFFGVSGYARRIQDVILTNVFQAGDGSWIATPVNSGRASVYGVELEAKAKLSKLVAELPDVDVRAGVGLHDSHVAAIPSPGNRLSRQPPLTASVGMDYRFSDVPVTLGASFSYEKHDLVRTSLTQSQRQANKRALDLYGVWRVSTKMNLRATVINLLQAPGGVFTTYSDNTLRQDRDLSIQSHRSLRLTIDLKL